MKVASNSPLSLSLQTKTLHPLYWLWSVLLLLLWGLQSGCTEQSGKQDEAVRTVIHGRILHPAGDNASISIADTSYQTVVDEEGRFTLAFPLKDADYARLRIGPEYTLAYLRPGDSLELRLDAESFDLTLTYTGTGMEINNYMAAKMVRNQQQQTDGGNPYLLDEAAYREKCDANYRQLVADLERSELEEAFSAREKRELDFAWAANLARYPEAHRYYADNDSFQVSETYWDFANSLDLNHPDNAQSDQFMDFAKTWLGYKASSSGIDPEDAGALYTHQMELLPELISEPSLRHPLASGLMKEYLNYYGMEGAEPVHLRYLQLADTESASHREVEALYAEWAKLAPGSPAPVFAGTRLDGSSVSLSDLKGKAVYVDVWATWCGPCRAELPHLETLQQAFEGDESVVFLSISIDDDKSAWEEMVTEKSMGGLQLFADGAWSSDVVERYQINGIPRFLIIRPDGTIQSAQAPRPSSGEVEAILREITEGALAQR